MKKISITIEIDVKDLEDMIKEAGCRIINKAKFDEMIQTDEFRKSLVEDMLQVWNLENEDGDLGEVVISLFGEEFVEFDDED